MADVIPPVDAIDPTTWQGPWKRRFRPNLWLSLIALAMLVMLVMLGNWQRGRYYEAIGGLKRHADQYEGKPALTRLGEVPGEADSRDRLAGLQYRRAKLTGTLEVDKAQLLTARYVLGKRGYGVMIPMKVAGGPLPRVLVHLGWLPQDKVAAYLKEIEAKPERTVEGRLHITPSAPERRPTGEFAGKPTWVRAYPKGLAKTIEGLEPRLLLQVGTLAVGKPMEVDRLPYDGFVHPVRIAPSKHVEYAATWYGLAGTLVLVWIALSLTKVPLVVRGEA